MCSCDLLEKFGVKRSLLAVALNRQKPEVLYALERARGSLPPGTLGQVWFNDAAREVDQFIERWGHALAVEFRPPVSHELSIDGTGLRADIDAVSENRQLLYRCGKTRPKDLISVWIRHLFACASEGYEGLETRFFAMDRAKKYLCFGSVDPQLAHRQIGRAHV